MPEGKNEIFSAFPAAAFIPSDVWVEFEKIGKIKGRTAEQMIVTALKQWLGRE